VERKKGEAESPQPLGRLQDSVGEIVEGMFLPYPGTSEPVALHMLALLETLLDLLALWQLQPLGLAPFFVVPLSRGIAWTAHCRPTSLGLGTETFHDPSAYHRHLDSVEV